MKKRVSSLLLAVMLLVQLLPAPSAYAEGLTCTHHTHDAACGWAEAVQGVDCSHTHDEAACYTAAAKCAHTCDENCTIEADKCTTHTCDEACVEKVENCVHFTHDDTCGYVAAKEASACTYDASTCELCKAAEAEKCEAHGNNKTTCQECADAVSSIADSDVAKIGETGYATLAAALAAANNGDVIKLLANVEWETSGSYGGSYLADHSVTIDGQNTYTLTATGEGVGEVGVSSGTLTLQNLTLVDKSTSYNEGAWEFGYLEFNGNLYAVNVTFSDPIMFVGANAAFSGCTFTGKTTELTQYGAWVQSGDVTFTTCSFIGTRGLKTHTEYEGNDVGTVKVDHCTFTVTDKPGVAIGKLASDDTVKILDSTFKGVAAGDQSQYSYESDTALTAFTLVREGNSFENLTFAAGKYLNEGTYDVDVSAYVADGYQATEKNGKWLVEAKPPVASVGDKNYTSLAEAVEGAANAAGTSPVEVELPEAATESTTITDAVAAVVSNGSDKVELTVPVSTGSVTLSNEVIKAIGSDAAVELEIAPVAAETTATQAAYDITLKVNDTAKSQLGGEVTVRLPLLPGLVGVPEVYHVEDDGTETPMNAQVSGSDLEFTTNHFSNFLQKAKTGSNWTGTGTETDPYVVTTADQLRYFAELVNNGDNFQGKYVKLGADIDLSGMNWTPIGYKGKVFKGIFDGDGKTISNLSAVYALDNTSENNGIGLFGKTESPAEIKNLTIENATVKGSLYVGAVVGQAYTGKGITNCHVKGNIKIDAYWYAGVITGGGYASPISGCTVVGNDGSYIKGNGGSYIGGICGFRGEGANAITGCSVTNVDISGVDRVGGISGMAHAGNTISDSSVAGVTVSASNPDSTSVGLIAGANNGGTKDNNGNVMALSKIINNTASNTTANIDSKAVTNHAGGTSENQKTPATIVGTGVTFNDAGEITDGTFEVAPPTGSVATGTTIEANDDGSYSAITPDTTWTGSGTEDEPYLITSREELMGLANRVNGGESFVGKFFKLTADIDLKNQGWTPIGYFTDPDDYKVFAGTFDGNGHTISNLKVSSGNATGLFGNASAEGSAIKNLTVENANVTGGTGVGAVAGRAGNTNFTNVTVTGSIQISGTSQVGGIAGYAGGVDAVDCKVQATTTGTVTAGSWAGGMFGHAYDGINVTGCSVSGLNVSGAGVNGGLVGCVNNNSNIQGNTVSNTTVTTTYESSNTDVGTRKWGAGVIAGGVQGNAIIVNNTGTNVTLTGNYTNYMAEPWGSLAANDSRLANVIIGTSANDADVKNGKVVSGTFSMLGYGTKGYNPDLIADGSIVSVEKNTGIITVKVKQVDLNQPDGPEYSVNYVIEYYFDNVLDKAKTEIKNGKIGTDVAVEAKDFKGYILNKDKSVLDGTLKAISEQEPLILKLYYETEKPAEPETKTYKVIKGAGQTVHKGEKAAFTANIDYEKFTGVLINGKKLSERHYEHRSGSTVVILKPSYTESLKARHTYTLTIQATDGQAETTFRVKSAPVHEKPEKDYDSDSPKTGDTTNQGLWLAIAALGIAGMLASIFGKKYLIKRK